MILTHNGEIKRCYDQEVERYFRLLDHIENCQLWLELDKYNGYRAERVHVTNQLNTAMDALERVKQRLIRIDGCRKVPVEALATIDQMEAWNHNKYNLEAGDIVMLDAKHKGRSMVYIHSFTPNKMFATVYPLKGTPADSWQTMTVRLSPIVPPKTKDNEQM